MINTVVEIPHTKQGRWIIAFLKILTDFIPVNSAGNYRQNKTSSQVNVLPKFSFLYNMA
jgi:hypothetical protein